MIDIHSHLIYGVDDGSPSIKESIRMVLEAEKLGIKTVFATPHFNEDTFDAEKTKGRYQELLQRVADCGIELHMGHEVMISPYLPKLIKQGNGPTLGNSRYMLIELPFDSIPVYSGELIYRLHAQNIVPIIAHPERNRIFVRNFDAFIAFAENGCLFQVDAASIVGFHGNDVKKFARQLIKLDIAHFVASDAHSTNHYKEWYLQAYEQVKKWAGEECAAKLFEQNAKKIILSHCTH